MTFFTFDLERWQSTWENRVRHNLSESGVHPLTARELLALAGASADPLLDGRKLFQEGKFTEALAFFEHVIEVRPTREAWHCAGAAAYWARNPSRALEYWNSLLDTTKRGSASWRK